MKTFFLQVQKVVKETDEAISIYFWHPINEQIKYLSGQFITLMVPVEGGKKERRSYSMCSSPFVDTGIAITVKRVEGGIVSNYLFDKIKSGDFIEVIEPMGRFVYLPEEEPEGDIVLIGAGSGITPLFSILKTVLWKSPTKKVYLVYGNRINESIIFRKELEILENTYPDRLKVVHVLSRPAEFWVGYKGRINQANAIFFFKDFGIDFKKDMFYMCGPNLMMDQMNKVFSLFDVPEEHVMYERFNSPADEDTLLMDSTNQLKKESVTVHYDGETYVFDVEPHQTILEAALDLDIDLPYSCQAGMCTACLGKCLNGSVKMDEDEGLTEKEISQGYILTCVSHPTTKGVEIEID